MRSPARFLDALAAPQSARHIVEDFGVEFLPTEAAAFVAPDNLLQERISEICAVLVSRAACDDHTSIKIPKYQYVGYNLLISTRCRKRNGGIGLGDPMVAPRR